MNPATLWRVVRAGSRPARSVALRSWAGARRLAVLQAALQTRVVPALADAELDVETLAEAIGSDRPDLVGAFLQVLQEYDVVRPKGGTWRLTRLGQGLVDDPVAWALVESFAGYHLDLYRDLPQQLSGGADRDDLERHAALIATVSSLMEPFIRDELTKVMSELVPSTVLDVGCGSGRLLVHMLVSSRAGHGIGIDLSSEAIRAAARTAAEAGVGDLVDLATGSALDLIDELAPAGSVDLALVANVIYYFDAEQRAHLFRLLDTALAPGGEVLLVTTDNDGSAWAAHFDLLLRSQAEPTALVPQADIVADLQRAGFQVRRTKRITPGEPLIAVLARKAGSLGG